MIARYQLMQAGSGQRRLERNDEYGLLVKFEDYERLRADIVKYRQFVLGVYETYSLGDLRAYVDSFASPMEKLLCDSHYAGTPLRKPDLSDPGQAALAAIEPEDGCFSGAGEPDANR